MWIAVDLLGKTERAGVEFGVASSVGRGQREYVSDQRYTLYPFNTWLTCKKETDGLDV